MRFQSFLREFKKQRRMVEKRKKRKSEELSNPVRKKIRVPSPPSLSLSSAPSSLSPSLPSSPPSPTSLSLPLLPSSLFLSSPPYSLSPSLPSSPPSPTSLSLSSLPSSLSLSSPPSSLSPSSLPSSSYLSSPPSSMSPLLPSSSSSPPSLPSPRSSSSSHNWTHDVFPSFRGEDVRRSFLSHIQKEFERKGITPFNDNGIKRGKSIGPELIRAIRGSKIAIILISKNYASSSWCLDELVEIMKCEEELGQTVLAIFYKVDPSDVKKLTGYFGEVFKKTCADKSKEDIRRWRQALEKVAKIAGYHSINWDDEANMIETIAKDVSNKLINNAPSSDFDGFVGMRAHMENMKPLLLLGSNEVRMIGIWGPSGIGKSTIARVLFWEHSSQFQFSVFMADIKRRYPRLGCSEYSTQLQLQEEFLSSIFNQKDIKIHHLGVVQDRLKDKRVLVVLDDVDHLDQLYAVAKATGWFGPGSRIIITTQDKGLLNAHGINHVYKVGFPRYNEALEIFCMYAFGQKAPYDGFEKLAWEVTRLAGSLPLGLKVMGSYLKGRPEEEWWKELPRLRTSLDGDIESVLEFSYNALLAEDKELFLYIACFFNNVPMEKVETHLANHFPSVSQGLKVLAERSLISITTSYNGLTPEDVCMHDLLARFGREIVRRQSLYDPGQRQFLVNVQDICKVLKNDTLGSERVVGLQLDYDEIEDELIISEGSFERMSGLQFLRTTRGDRYKHSSPNYLPRKVKLLHCGHSLMTCLPSNFNTDSLVELNMPHSKLEKLWDGIKTIKNLKWMDLSRSSNLKELPDLSTATNLRVLKLQNCSGLVKLPSSIGNATKLLKLDLSGCSNLVELPSSIGNLINLTELYLSGCSNLVELLSSIGNLINLKHLDLRSCSNLVELPSSIGNATKLLKLDLSGCSNLVELPSSIGNLINLTELYLIDCSNLEELPSSIGNLINLTELYLIDCSNLEELPSFIGNLINLEQLDLRSCSNLVELPSSIGNATKLLKLDLSGCSNLVELPSSIGNATKLLKLDLSGCSNLVELPSSIGNLINLTGLDISGCSNLVELPSSIGNLINLEQLDLRSCSNLVELPSSIGNLNNLEQLDLKSCSNLVELPSSIGNLINLKHLDLRSCSNLVELPSSIGNATKLLKLDLSGCSSLVELPSSIGNLINLAELNVSRCSSLAELPSSIGNATKLRKLDISGCSSLVELPSSIGNLINLTELDLSWCSSLEVLLSSIWNATKLLKLNLSCSSLVEFPYSIGDLINLTKLDLSSCSSLVKLPSSIGNLINLTELDISDCSSLEELPSSIGNATKLLKLDLIDCSNLEELPSSIGNLINLKHLDLRSCSNLVELPSSIGNATKLLKLDLSGCSSLVELPSSIGNLINLTKLDLNWCSNLVELPSSIGNLINLKHLDLRSCSNLVELPSSIGNATKLLILDLSGCSSLVELPYSIGDLINLTELEIVGCTNLVSLPELPSSLEDLFAENCESLEKLDCSFYKTEFDRLLFSNCFKLNQEARDLITKTSLRSNFGYAVLPGEKVPTYFTYRNTGSSVSVNLNETDTHFPISLRFKACILIGEQSKDTYNLMFNCRINGVWVKMLNRVNRSLVEHLLLMELEAEVSSCELLFEFKSLSHPRCEIGGCGIRTL
ncbi:disease resistance protein TAO1 isoform X16 [Eutrema salsugineum]|uniref:disease resistance protein TAO1 isoform X16 n=1 Tax=Eutrema salsugineum TaxID=72664 RepID=UPI000CED6FDC|nr:disease resistance protein TAO1 isoform X16 [Eutrema salsugineum]